jgi:cysteinyl-tRNA synthetase
MSDGFEGLRLYNTLTRAKEDFVPIDRANVRMYVCGPTVYDYAHIGNARPAIVFDVLFRLLRHLYGEDHVTYVRNITDVDDKINARALRDYGAEIAAGTLSLNEAIRKVTEPTYDQYQKDVAALGCLPPTHQPRATEFVLPRADGKADMVTLIQSLIDRGHAYVSNGEVLFDVSSMADYGQLSKRPLDEQQAGARIAVEAHKRNPADFVLWKESSADEPGWEASFRLKEGSSTAIRGRPGWHIECSAMSDALLWDAVKDRLSPAAREHPHQFDIHGGGLDLIFPHHENEIAQSRCAHGTHAMARCWLHNGFLQVEGKKMSKSDGNFVTINELLETETFGGRKWPGEVLRLAMLMTHYREPIDFSVRRLEEAERIVLEWTSISEQWRRELRGFEKPADYRYYLVPAAIQDALKDDLNSPSAIRELQKAAKRLNKRIGPGPLHFFQFSNAMNLLGISAETPDMLQEGDIDRAIANRLALIAQKNWPEADRIRDELLAQGIQLKDGKDPATGERVTTWEVRR